MADAAADAQKANAEVVKGGGRRRFTDKEENFLFTFFYMLAAEIFLLGIVYFINTDFLNIKLGDQCCAVFNMWDILTPINILGFIAFAAVVAAIASRTLI